MTDVVVVRSSVRLGRGGRGSVPVLISTYLDPGVGKDEADRRQPRRVCLSGRPHGSRPTLSRPVSPFEFFGWVQSSYHYDPPPPLLRQGAGIDSVVLNRFPSPPSVWVLY